MKRMFLAIRYVFLFRKAVTLGSENSYLEACKILYKIDSSKLKGKSLFRFNLLNSVLLYAVGEYKQSKRMMEKLYVLIASMTEFNKFEKLHLKTYIIEHYNLMKDVISIDNTVIPKKIESQIIDSSLVANSIKNVFPI